jgi:hypothetical protein
VPVDERGNVKHPVNTDELILNVCNDKLGLDINKVFVPAQLLFFVAC